MQSEEVTNEKSGESHDHRKFWKEQNSYLLQRCGNYTSLPDELMKLVTFDAIQEAQKIIKKEGYVRETPLIDGISICGPGNLNKISQLESFGLKCENMQFSGSFKIRGASYQFSQFPEIKTQKLVTISAGNYGTAFATLAKEIGVAKNAMVIMPNTVPERRKTRIEAFGVKVNCKYHQSDLMSAVSIDQQERQSAFLHPFDDVNVILGHASAGLEILEQEPLVDIILVCCGGGGFLAGVTSAIRLSGNTRTKVYGVEHVLSILSALASTMFDSLIEDEIAYMKEDPGKTICHGISAPYTGNIPFKVFRAFGDGVIKIDDSEVKRAVRLLYGMGLVVEPSGAASVAAVLSKKVPDIAGKKVVAFVTGGNVSPHELQEKCGITI